MAFEAAALHEPALVSAAPLLREASRMVGREVADLLQRYGDAPYTKAVHRRVVLRVNEALAKASAIAHQSANSGLAQIRDRATNLAASHAQTWATSAPQLLGKGPTDVDFNAKAAAQRSARALTKRHEAAARKIAEDLATDVRKRLALGHVRGERASDVLRRMQGRKADHLATALADRHGKVLERLIRTEAGDAYNETAMASARMMGAETFRWDATIDRRTCPACRDLHGRVLPLSAERPPLHPHCRCVATIWDRAWKP